ncbi:hypothetical protein V1460_35835 [Streptomyces sp. SCSIO 30461]|uniref:hypothetical protein n=1 Tax=Streptomyces sp. SCSIO 30461 TaxID=3118085 RepID=UPI0030D147E8
MRIRRILTAVIATAALAGLGLTGAAAATAATTPTAATVAAPTPGECERGGGMVDWETNLCMGGMHHGRMVD